MTQDTPERPLSPLQVRAYGTDTAKLIADYPDFAIFAFPGGDHGARARVCGKPAGDLITAMSLDELADRMDLARRRDAGT